MLLKSEQKSSAQIFNNTKCMINSEVWIICTWFYSNTNKLLKFRTNFEFIICFRLFRNTVNLGIHVLYFVRTTFNSAPMAVYLQSTIEINPLFANAKVSKQGNNFLIQLVDSQNCSIPLMRDDPHISMHSFESLIKPTSFQKFKTSSESSPISFKSPTRRPSDKGSCRKPNRSYQSAHSWPKSQFYEESRKTPSF